LSDHEKAIGKKELSRDGSVLCGSMGGLPS
jgi:hypothetical protein